MEDIVLISPPATEPVELEDAKIQARVYHDLEDDYIENIIIPEARASVEGELQRALITQTWLYKLDGFPGWDPKYESRWYPEILLPKPPFQSIVSFTYIDTAGVTQTLYECLPDGTTPTIDGEQQYYGYRIDPGSTTQPARLLPPWARPWPPSRRISNAVQITFVAGYGPITDATQSPAVTTWIGGSNGIPHTIKRDILMRASYLYDNRNGENPNQLDKLKEMVQHSGYVNRIA
jgi:uncharacterized phiE125 gp8 family phage protein